MKPSKLEVCRALLFKGSVFVHLDPRKPGVLVPARLRVQAQVVLQWGRDMPVPIPDMEVDKDGISGTLTFKGVPFLCMIPWESVFAVVGEDAKGMVWDEVMPSEIKAEIKREQEKQAENVVKFDSSIPRKASGVKVTGRTGADRSHLKLVR